METNLIDNCMRLGFGMMRLPRIKGTNTIDLELSKRMVDAFMEAGSKYFDTAYVYEGSEAATKATLCDRYPRESYYLHSQLDWQKDDIEYAIASYADDMSHELYEMIANGRDDFLREHSRFQEDITKAVELLEKML